MGGARAPPPGADDERDRRTPGCVARHGANACGRGSQKAPSARPEGSRAGARRSLIVGPGVDAFARPVSYSPQPSSIKASMPGRAMKASHIVVGGVAIYPTGAILGKAMEPLRKGTGVIRALVTLR